MDFDKNLNRLITGRLKSNLKAKLYVKQNGLCAFCDEIVSERELLTCSPKIHIHYTVSANESKNNHTQNKFYNVFGDKILLHDKCYPALCKSRRLSSNKRLFCCN